MKGNENYHGSLGLPNKKDNVTEMLYKNNVKICCLQETELPKNFPVKMLNCGGYNFCNNSKNFIYITMILSE